MRALGLLRYDCENPEDVLSLLPKKEEERLSGKAREYILSSAMGRLLLFSLCDRLFGKDAYEKTVAYRKPVGAEGSGCPYLPSMEKLFVSISHTEGGCAVMISDEGECGVDIENITAIQDIKKERLEKIKQRFYLEDFQIENTENNEELSIIIYKFNKKQGIFEETSGKIDKINGEKTSFENEFLTLYTRMEATGKAAGLGVSFLKKRKEYLSRVRLQGFLFEPFVISVALVK